MTDRQYRQRGYQDDQREREPKRQEKRGEMREARARAPGAREPRKVNMPGYRDVIRCARCGHLLDAPTGVDTRCPRCGADLHACAQCTWFDTSSRFECAQPVAERISPKDARNECTFFDARITVERETHSKGPTDTRKAFDDLFK